MSEIESKAFGEEVNSRSRAPIVLVAFATILLLVGIGTIVANLGEPAQPNELVMSATIKPKEAVHNAVNTARATTRLTAESIRTVLNKVDPNKFGPSKLPFKIGFTPNENLNGGRLVLDLGEEGILIDYITVSGKVTTDFETTFDPQANAVTVTIQMNFDEARVHVDEDENSTVSGTVTLNGTITSTTVIQGFTATCTLTGPLEIQVNNTKVKIYTGGVNATLDGLGATVVFNGSSRIDIDYASALKKDEKWRLTFIDLLFNLKTASIDSGRFKVERLATLVKFTVVYKFLYPNGGDRVIYPGGFTEPFTLEPPEDRPPEAPTDLTATAAGETQVNLTWTDNSVEGSNERKFRIDRREVGESWPVLSSQSIGIVGADTTSFSDTTAAPGTAYEYRVIAANHRGDSAPSNTAAVITPPFLTFHSMTPTSGKLLDGHGQRLEVVFTAANVPEGLQIDFAGNGTSTHRAQIKSITVDPSGIATIVTEPSVFSETGPVTLTAGGQTVSAGTFTLE